VLTRRALPTDARPLAALAERTFREAYSDSNDPANMDAYVASSFTEEAIARDLADPLATYLVASLEPMGPFVAYAKVLRSEAPPCVSGPSPIELSRFYVSKELHGMGAAHELMSAVIDLARSFGARTLWLGVWEKNPRAIAFYGKQGFRDVGSHEFVLGSDVQSDRVLTRAV
jgi:ribosomal protein S18 acetylase RimI-like enzyme